MKLRYYVAIMSGVITFASLITLFDLATNTVLTAVCAIVSLHIGWVIASPSTAANCYSKIIKELFGRDFRGEPAGGLTSLFFFILWVFIPFIFAFGHYYAITEFWIHVEWNTSFFEYLAGSASFFSNYNTVQSMLGIITLMLLLFFCWPMSIIVIIGNLREKTHESLWMFASVFLLIAFNQYVALLVFGLLAILTTVAIAIFVGIILVGCIRLAGNAHMASVTAGICVGDAMCLYLMDWNTLAMTIILGTVSGWIAGEVIHRLGKIFLRNGVGDIIFTQW